MHEAAVQCRVGVCAQHGDPRLARLARHPGDALSRRQAGEVADRACDHGEAVAATRQIARHLVVAGAAWLIQGGESLVDQQDVHRGLQVEG